MKRSKKYEVYRYALSRRYRQKGGKTMTVFRQLGKETCICSRIEIHIKWFTFALHNQNVEAVRVLNHYDLENVDEEDYIAAKYTILSEPQVDFFMKKHLHQIMMNIFLRQSIRWTVRSACELLCTVYSTSVPWNKNLL